MLAAMGHPNPSVRKEVIMCVVRYFQQTKVLPDRAIMKPIVEAGMKAMDDQDKDVRETASELLGTVMKLFGERSMLNYMEQLDKIKQDKRDKSPDLVTDQKQLTDLLTRINHKCQQSTSEQCRFFR